MAAAAGGGAAIASVGPFAGPDRSRELTYQEASDYFGIAHGTTEDGRTFGGSPWTLGKSEEPHVVDADGVGYPNLVAVVGDHGTAGYVDRRKMEKDPADLCAVVVHPVYASDGVSKLDTFTVGPVRVNAHKGWSANGTGWSTCE